MLQVLKVRNPATNRDKFYDKKTGKLIAYYEPPDDCGDQELTITDFGSQQGYRSFNRKLFDGNVSRFVFGKKGG